jgi:galactose mutarotase-like enzyme
MLTIENSKFEVKVNPIGAELSGLFGKEERAEYLWQGLPEIWELRSPLLFPVVGRLLNDTYRYGEKEYAMPKHGFLMKERFDVKEQKEDSLTLVYNDFEKHYENYPFASGFFCAIVLTRLR